MSRIHCRDDEGVSLILALVVMSVVGIVIASLLTFGASAFTFSTTAQSQRSIVYSADSALQGAIANSRYVSLAGIANDSTNCAYTPPVVNGVSGLTVSCLGQTGSGGSGGNNALPNAILTLATGTQSEGMTFTGGGSADLYVQGQLYSHTLISNGITVHVSNSDVVTWDGTAADNCSGSGISMEGTSPGQKHCGDPNHNNPDGKDPLLSPASSTVPGTPSAAQCLSKNNVVEFFPGKYTAVPAAPAACSAAGTWWFSPGTYFFDFAGPKTTWTPTTDLVAGTPRNWDPTKDKSPPASGDACDYSVGNTGAQFVFGGGSQLSFPNSSTRFEICATLTASAIPIAIYGVGTTAQALGYDGPTSCFTNAPYTGEDSTHCALLTMANNSNKPDLVLHGTVYAPKYALNFNFHNLNSESGFDGGMVVRALRADISSSFKLTTPLFATGTSRDAARDVVFTVRYNGTPVLVSEVQYTDATTGGNPGLTEKIVSWSATP